MSPDLAFALAFADPADAITPDRFRRLDLPVETKPDRSPVTEADGGRGRRPQASREASGPGDGWSARSSGPTGRGSPRWTVDPIDGTRNYLRGLPMWATLIALEQDGRSGRAVSGRHSRGAGGRRAAGAFANGHPIRVSRVAELEDAVLCYALEQHAAGVAQRCWHPRAYGDFWAICWSPRAPPTAVERPGSRSGTSPRPQPIVEEAGGPLHVIVTAAPGWTAPLGDLLERAPARGAPARSVSESWPDVGYGPQRLLPG